MATIKDSAPLEQKVDLLMQIAAMNSQQIPEDDEISLYDLYKVIRKRWYFIPLTVLFTLSFSIYYLFTTKDIYEAETHIIPLGGRNNIEMEILDTSDLSMLKDIVQASMPTVFSSPTTSKIHSTILSQEFLIFVIEKYNLLPLIFPDSFDSDKKQWDAPLSCDAHIKDDLERITGIALFSKPCHPTILDGYRYLFKNLTVTPSDKFKKDNNLIQISFQHTDPLFAQTLLRWILFEADLKLRQKAIKLASDNQEYLSDLMNKTTNEKILSRLQTLLNTQLEQAMYAQTKASFLYEIMEQPIKPDIPIKPKRKLVLVLAIILGFMLAIFFIFIANAIENFRSNTPER